MYEFSNRCNRKKQRLACWLPSPTEKFCSDCFQWTMVLICIKIQFCTDMLLINSAENQSFLALTIISICCSNINPTGIRSDFVLDLLMSQKKQQQNYSFSWCTQQLEMMWIYNFFTQFNPLIGNHTWVNVLAFNPNSSLHRIFLQILLSGHMKENYCRLGIKGEVYLFPYMFVRLHITGIKSICYFPELMCANKSFREGTFWKPSMQWV